MYWISTTEAKNGWVIEEFKGDDSSQVIATDIPDLITKVKWLLEEYEAEGGNNGL